MKSRDSATRSVRSSAVSGLSTLIKDHLAGGASRLAALLLAQILPVFSVVAPCHPGAALRDLVLVQRGQATRRVCLSLAVAVCLSACRGSPTAALDAAAEFYVRAALALGERDADSLDIYYGPGAWRADAHLRHLPLDDIRAATVPFIASLDERPFDNAEAEARRLFLLRQTRAIVSRIDIVRGARPSFAEEVRTLFGLGQDGSASAAYAASASAPEALRRDKSARPAFAADAATARQAGEVYAELGRLLPGAGDLPARYAAFDGRFLIPRNRLPAVLARAVEGCRAATREHVTLPPGERVDVEYVPDLAWSAYTRYQGHATSRIQINAALPLTVDRALDLACHEAYPGHHTIDSLLDARFGGRRVEFSVRPLFSPQSLLHEAAASLAVEMAFPGPARLAFERDDAVSPGRSRLRLTRTCTFASGGSWTSCMASRPASRASISTASSTSRARRRPSSAMR